MLARFPADSFESRFSGNSTRQGLGLALDRNELTLLFDTAFCVDLCNLAINGSERYGGETKSEQEARRRKLELDFMTARDIFYASPGWQTLTPEEQATVEQTFLTVLVADDKLAC